jgi:hypothetical protein
LYLAEKNYKNLLEALTNNAINSAVASSSNLTLSLPSSCSSIFIDLLKQDDISRIEESEIYNNDKSAGFKHFRRAAQRQEYLED